MRVGDAFPGAVFHALEVDGFCGTAGFAFSPQFPQALDVFPSQLALELPVPNGLADNFAGGRVLSGIDCGLEGAELLGGESDADFLDSGHANLWSIVYYLLLLMGASPGLTAAFFVCR